MRHSTGLPWQYGFLSPLLDLTTGVFPVTMVDLEKDVVPANFEPLTRKDGQIRDICKLLTGPHLGKQAKQCRSRFLTRVGSQTDGGPQNHANALVGLSLIARRLEEEKVVAMLQLIKNTVGTDYDRPAGQLESHLHLMNL